MNDTVEFFLVSSPARAAGCQDPLLELRTRYLEVLLRTEGGQAKLVFFFVVPISRQRGGGGCQLAVVCVSPRPPAWLRLLLLLSFDV